MSSVMSVTPISSIWSAALRNSVSDITLRTGKPSAWSQSTTTLLAARSASTQSRGGVAEWPASSGKSLSGQRDGVGVVAKHGGESGVGVDDDAVESGGEHGYRQRVQ
jgi:hypothetical protein